MIGLVITLALIATAAVSLVYTPRDPLEMSIAGRLQGPTLAHPLGTDQFGRDLLSRVMRGAITAILVGVIAVAIGMLVGVAAALLVAAGQPVTGFAVLWLSGLIDAADGTLARLTKSSPLGAILDITFDRVVEVAMILALACRFRHL